MGSVFHEAVAIEIAIIVHPVEGGTNIRPYLLNESAIPGALVIGSREHDEQWRRIHGTVIFRKWNLVQVRHLAVAKLVQNLSWLGLILWINLDGLSTCQIFKYALGEFWLHPQHLHGRDDAVAAEYRAEPRNTCIRIIRLRIA